MEAIKDYIDEMEKESRNIKNQLIIDDIFDISNGVYETYDVYVQYKQKLIDDIRKSNEQCLTAKDNRYIFTYYVEPIIINEHDFNYIVSKYNRHNYNDKITLFNYLCNNWGFTTYNPKGEYYVITFTIKDEDMKETLDKYVKGSVEK